MLVRESILEFERGKDPKDQLGIGSEYLIKKFKDNLYKDDNFYERSNDYVAKDNVMYIVLFYDQLSEIRSYSNHKIKDIFNDNPYFEFDELKEMKVINLDLKHISFPERVNYTRRVILKFKWK